MTKIHSNMQMTVEKQWTGQRPLSKWKQAKYATMMKKSEKEKIYLTFTFP